VDEAFRAGVPRGRGCVRRTVPVDCRKRLPGTFPEDGGEVNDCADPGERGTQGGPLPDVGESCFMPPAPQELGSGRRPHHAADRVATAANHRDEPAADESIGPGDGYRPLIAMLPHENPTVNA
jgi:hypothetical protein